MTIAEVKSLVAESIHKNEFVKFVTEIDLPHINYHQTLTGIVHIYDYFARQLEGFKKYTLLPEEFGRDKDSISRLINTIIHYIKNPTQGSSTLKNYLRHFKLNNTFFPTETTEFIFLIKLFTENKDMFIGAYNFLTGQINKNANREQFVGHLLGYEFYMRQKGINKSNNNIENESIDAIRNQLLQKLGSAEQQLTEYLTRSKTFADANAEDLIKYKEEKVKEYNEWYTNHTLAFEGLTNDSAKKNSDLEELYKAKLRLEAPAKYWNDRAKQLRKEGYWWLAGLVFSVLIGIGILVWILNKTADGTIKEIFSETSTAVKWSVALITLISFLAYIIRVLAKLTFSSFHLVRDAEEREQLTYIYLALQKESKIDTTERHLIMQSLFSRADTGLLKDDASPTMPGNIIDQVIKK